jgi:hypothetical protein
VRLLRVSPSDKSIQSLTKSHKTTTIANLPAEEHSFLSPEIQKNQQTAQIFYAKA